MSIEANKATILCYYEEVLNRGNFALLQEIAIPQYDEHDPLPGQTNGIEGLEQRVRMLYQALRPHFTLQDVIAEGDKVVVRWINQGTLVEPFLGLPPTGGSFSHSGIDIHLLRDGKMAEHWHVVDMVAMLQQLGLFPQPSETGA
jgi:predicted ester cyclase